VSRRLRSHGRTIVAVLLLVAACLEGGAPLQAQPPGLAQEEFKTLPPGELGQEQLPATPLVFAAYAFVWVVLLMYVLFLWSRLRRVEQELADVTTKLRGR
jgi:CcmD family protein